MNPELQAPAAATSQAPRRGRKRAFETLRWGVTLGAFAYLFSVVDAGQLTAAASALSGVSVAVALGFTFVGLLAGALRWSLLLRAFAAPHPPRLFGLTRLYFVGLFYNTFLPGGVGGDLVRAAASRSAFGAQGLTPAAATVLVERLLGLSGLLLLTGTATWLFPVHGVQWLPLLGAIGTFAALAACGLLLLGRRLAPRLPGPLRSLAAALPALERPQYVPAALGLSVLTNLAVALSGHALLSAMASGLRLWDSLQLVPIASAAAFFPFTVSGYGVRETAFVHLFAGVGLSKATAFAGALCLWACQAAAASLGGLLALVERRAESPQ